MGMWIWIWYLEVSKRKIAFFELECWLLDFSFALLLPVFFFSCAECCLYFTFLSVLSLAERGSMRERRESRDRK